jgi:hypothetical protein
MSHSDYANSLTAKAFRLSLALLFAVFFQPAFSAAQCSLSCNDGLQISLDATGKTLITIPMIAPNAPNSCPGTLELRLFKPPGIPLPNNILDCSHIGLTITAQVKHLASGNSCSGTLEVSDFLPPAVVCSDKFIFCNQDPSPANVGIPTMTDNCTPSNQLDYSHFDEETPLPCGTMQGGYLVLKRIDRTWLVSDAYGNSTNCLQKIWLKHITMANVVFPPNLDGIVSPSLNCGQDPYDLALTGQPTVEGIPIENSPECEFGVTYSDQVINICPPAGYSVIRTWTAVDFCTNQITNRIQIIKVEDKTPPEIAPLSNLTVGTDGFLCSGTVEFPQAQTTDDCSAVTVAPKWFYGSGFGPFIGIPEGTHVVTYTATDACGNSKTATMTVTVADSSPPLAVCASSTQISLTAGGIGFVNAGTVGANSFDNCSAVTLTISRNDSLYTPSIQVTCADIGTPLPVILRVTDASGLENFCETEVDVRDYLKPNVQCPPNVTLTCLQNHKDLQLTGQATASDNCALQSLDFTDINFIQPCNIGSVTRLWKATDAQGNTKTCIQQITLNVVSNVAVTFPPNTTVNKCDDPSAILPPKTGAPTTSGQHCSPLSITYSDQIFDNPPPPACWRIFRTWKVIDFCVYDINDDSTGIWEQIQVIDIVDDVPPLLSLPANLTLNADQPDCSAQVTLPDATATDCDAQFSISNNSIFALSQGANASGIYPLGTHQIVFSATDNCGNFAQKTLTITVKDTLPPNAVCKNGLVLNLDSTGMGTLDAAPLNDGSFDPCWSSSSLSFSVSPNVFSCQTLGGQQVTLTVTDPAGNFSTCTTNVEVADPTGACLPPPPLGFVVEGTIRTETGKLVAEIPLTLTGDGFSATADCDAGGHYLFENVPGNNFYTLKPANNAKWLNGLTTFDLVLISKHILGLDTLDSPFKLIAADANRSGTVTTFDIVQFRKVILGLLDTVPGNSSWRFVDVTYSFPDPANPFGEVFPEQKTFNTLIANQNKQDFTGIKIGDINNSVDAADPRSPRDTIFLTVPNRELEAGETAALPFYLKNWQTLEGFQFELALDEEKTILQKVEFSRPEMFGEGNFSFKNGKLTASWDNVAGKNALAGDSLLFTLYLSAKGETEARSILKMSGERLSPEAYRPDDESLAAVNLHFENTSPSANGAQFALLPARPNPFWQETAIPFFLTKEAELLLLVSDVSGKIVLQQKMEFPAGFGEWRIGKEALAEGAGVYYYRVVSPERAGQGGTIILTGK